MPKLQARTLKISEKVAGFQYKYCLKRTFFGDKCKEWKVDYYDLNDPATKAKLKAMGFVLKVKERIK